VDDNTFTGKDIKAYNIDEAAQWVSLWRRLSLSTRWYAGGGAAVDRRSCTTSAAGTAVRATSACSGCRRRGDEPDPVPLGGPSLGQQLRLFAETSNGLHGTYTGNFYRGDWRALPCGGPHVFRAAPEQRLLQPGDEPIHWAAASPSRSSGSISPCSISASSSARLPEGEPALTGHHSVLGSLEWRTPLAEVDRHLMVPPVGLDRLSMTLFFDVGSAWNDSASQRYFKSGGWKLLFEVRAGYLLACWRARDRPGVFEAPGASRRYLQVGRSF